LPTCEIPFLLALLFAFSPSVEHELTLALNIAGLLLRECELCLRELIPRHGNMYMWIFGVPMYYGHVRSVPAFGVARPGLD
jgi:hypothetical protein